MDLDERGDISEQTCMVAVWAVHSMRIQQGLLMCWKEGVDLTEDELVDLGTRWIARWHVGVSRHVRPRCFKCKRPQPASEDQLCVCFRKIQTGTWLVPINLQTVTEFRAKFGDDTPVQSIQCATQGCGRVDHVPAYVAFNMLKKRGRYKTPRFCMECYHKQQDEKGRGKPSRAPRVDATTNVGEKMKEKISLQDLQQKVSEENGPIAES